jgi:ribosomal protein L37AE/L43A
MGWIKQKKNEHVCPKPPLDDLIKPDHGDIWQCDHCGKRWIVLHDQRDGLYWAEDR